MSDMLNAVVIFTFYFLCECVPIFAIFVHHKTDFTKDLKPVKAARNAQDRARSEKPLEWNQIVSPGTIRRPSKLEDQNASFEISPGSSLAEGGKHKRQYSGETNNSLLNDRRNTDNSQVPPFGNENDAEPTVYEAEMEENDYR